MKTNVKTIEKTNTKTKRLGRPCIVDWGKVTLMWPNYTDAELSKKLNTSQVNVFLRRRKLMNKAEEAGKNPEFYACKRGKWARGRHTLQTA